MSRYENSSIYKICCKDPAITDIYIGSTTSFNRRRSGHKTKCNNEKDPAYNFYVYKFIRENGGMNNWDVIEVENISVKNKTELCTRERYWLEKLGASLNKYLPILTKNERIEQKKEYIENNKDKLKDYKKEYYEKNKDKIKEKNKKYHKNNKDKLNEKINCECGSIINKNSLIRHKKSKKHLKLVS